MPLIMNKQNYWLIPEFNAKVVCYGCRCGKIEKATKTFVAGYRNIFIEAVATYIGMSVSECCDKNVDHLKIEYISNKDVLPDIAEEINKVIEKVRILYNSETSIVKTILGSITQSDTKEKVFLQDVVTSITKITKLREHVVNLVSRANSLEQEEEQNVI